MLASLVPLKTPAGQDELAHRTRRLSQRHRTVLLLVDGRRTVQQVLQMAAAAGVSPECFEELVTLGLVAAHEPADGSAVDVVHVDLPLVHHSEFDPVGGDSVAFDSVAATPHDDHAPPPAEHLLPASQHGELVDLPHPPLASDEPEEPAAATGDGPLEEARDLLLRAVKNEAPVTGALTLAKLRRAKSRAELDALLDEVEQRIRKPRKQIIAAQLMRQVRHLLTLPA